MNQTELYELCHRIEDVVGHLLRAQRINALIQRRAEQGCEARVIRGESLGALDEEARIVAEELEGGLGIMRHWRGEVQEALSSAKKVVPFRRDIS